MNYCQEILAIIMTDQNCDNPHILSTICQYHRWHIFIAATTIRIIDVKVNFSQHCQIKSSKDAEENINTTNTHEQRN